MTETIREGIDKDEAMSEEIMPNRFTSKMQQAWIDGYLIPCDEHKAAIELAKACGASLANRVINKICDERVTAAYEAGKERARVLLGDFMSLPVLDQDHAELRVRARAFMGEG